MAIRKKSLNNTILYYMTLFVVVSVCAVGFLWISSDLAKFERDAETLRKTSIHTQKTLLQTEVQRAKAFIDHMRAQTDQRIKNTLKTRVYQAYGIAQDIYASQKETKPVEEIKENIKTALRSVRFGQGKESYFIFDLKGTGVLFPSHPGLVGKNMLSERDRKGRFLVSEMLDLIYGKGEGFCEYSLEKADEKGGFAKLGFIKLFEEFGWVIGTGEYIDEVKSEIQKECIAWISNIKFGNDGYVFAGQYDGLSLSDPGKGKNMFHIEDANGIKIVQELIAMAKSGGGFVAYILPGFNGRKPAPKISYAVGIDEWEWYVGAGLLVSDIDARIAGNRAELQKRIQWAFLKSVVALAILLAGILFFVKLVSDKIRSNLSLFTQFFRHAETTFIKIEPDAVFFEEFDQLALAANNMVEKRKSVEQALKISESERLSQQERLRMFMENAPVSIYMKDHNRKYLMVNQQFEKEFNVQRQRVIGHGDEELFSPENCQRLSVNDSRAIHSGHPIDCEEYIECEDGLHTYISTKFILKTGEDSQPVLCGISTDITERKQMEERLRLSREVIDTASEAMLITDHDGIILDANPAFLTLTGYGREEVIGNKPNITKSGRHDPAFYEAMWASLTNDGRWQGEIWDRKKSGEIFPKWLSISSIRAANGKISHYVGLSQDITQAKQSEKNLTELAFYDQLTKLPNRLLFKSHLKHCLESAARKGTQVALMSIDLDRFKNVNDSMGHTSGDRLLEKVAERLKDHLRKSDTVARIGGDEFTVLLSEPGFSNQAGYVAEKIIETIRAPFDLEDQEIYIDASIGISLYPSDATTGEDLLRCADLAMYRAKETGRGKYAFFTQKMNESIKKRHAIEADLRKAVLENEFILHYQPKIDLSDRSVRGMEALVRWQHPEKGLIPPFDFIPVAEETGLINPLGKWVLETACIQTKQWRDLGFETLKVAVNLSTRQFQEPDLIKVIRGALDHSGLSPDGLELEITESLLMEDIEKARKILSTFSQMGLSVSVDDFGTGYSSLSYLKHLPLESLKIDRSFIRDLHVNTDDQSIVSAVLSLARDLNLSVVAEGVENREQLEFLTKKDCQMVQGYYFSMPLPPDEFLKYLQA